MDFAEFSDIETVGFATYKQKLQEQFQEEAKKEIVYAYEDNFQSLANASLVVTRSIPFVGNALNLLENNIEARRLDNRELPNQTSKNILSRITAKFNETIDHVGKYVHVIQGKLTTAEQELEAKQVVINSLTAELDEMKEMFLSEDSNNISEAKRLKFQLRQANVSIVQLQKKLKACEDNIKRQSTLELNRIKAQHERKILEHQETINKIIKRNRQLQDKLNEKNDEDFSTFTQATVWVAEMIARSAGFKDVTTFVKNFVLIVKSLWRLIVIAGLFYTFMNTTDSYVDLIKNAWRGRLNRLHAYSLYPMIMFCMIKLLLLWINTWINIYEKIKKLD